jgi:ABC-2 type transport system permease protein
MVVWGYVLGGAADSLGRVKITDHRLTDLLDRLGGRTGLANAFLAAVLGITGLVVAAYTVQATLRLRIEEAAGRVEPLLATATGRIRWAFSHLIFAIAGTAVLLGLAGAAAGVAYGARVHDVGGQTARLFGAALAQAPAAWVLAGVGIALFGLVPRWTGLAWAALVGCLIVLEVGEILGLSQWLLDISPFAHVPKLPGSSFTAVPLLWLAAIAAGLVAGGLAGFRRRDLG